jgi:hypothetical protein
MTSIPSASRSALHLPAITTTAVSVSPSINPDMHSTMLATSAVEVKGRTTPQPIPDLDDSHEQSPDPRRKRRSFFGRTSSDASSRNKPLPTLNATLSSAKGHVVVPVDTPSSSKLTPKRPGTSGSEHHLSRRKTTDQLESIRNSIFGGRKFKLPKESRSIGKRSRNSHQVVVEVKKPDPADTRPIPHDLASRPIPLPLASPIREERPESRGNVGGQTFKDEYACKWSEPIFNPYFLLS